MISDCKSFVDAATLLIACGAKKVYIVATHGILSGNSLELIESCDAVHKVFNSISLDTLLIHF
jgi:ribose-phosphate pyrophosphokinase